jgi:hypothetical protein
MRLQMINPDERLPAGPRMMASFPFIIPVGHACSKNKPKVICRGYQFGRILPRVLYACGDVPDQFGRIQTVILSMV